MNVGDPVALIVLGAGGQIGWRGGGVFVKMNINEFSMAVAKVFVDIIPDLF